MAYNIIQAGTEIQLLSETGDLTTLTLPTGVTLRDDVPPRWVVYERYVILVNTPSEPLTIDATGTIRLLTPKPPRTAPILSAGSAGTLTGTYRTKETFVILDNIGNIIAESDYSPFSNQFAVTNQMLLSSGLDVSPDQISGRRLYRTTTNGAVYFQWIDLDGNVITSIQDDLSDAGLSLFAAPILGTPPRLTMIAEFRGRLFGVGDVDVDHVRYTEAGIQYAWPAENLLEIPSIGSDEIGITGLIPRREALGVGRRNSLIQVTGTGAETDGIPDFNVVILSKELGISSQESVKVYRDTAYFLWKDGVYAWDSSGVTCVSDGQQGKGMVRSWFTTDSYFNRDLFPSAFAQIDPDRLVYRLFLASAGSTQIDTWVEYSLSDGTWWGPHVTGKFRPLSAFNLTISNEDKPVVGGHDSTVYITQDVRTDGSPDSGVAIDFNALGKRHDIGVPDWDKYFGEISLFTKAKDTGLLTVIGHVGDVDSTTNLTMTYVMAKSRQRLGRLGVGKHCQIELSNNRVGEDVEIFGYEINPANVIGRR